MLCNGFSWVFTRVAGFGPIPIVPENLQGAVPAPAAAAPSGGVAVEAEEAPFWGVFAWFVIQWKDVPFTWKVRLVFCQPWCFPVLGVQVVATSWFRLLPTCMWSPMFRPERGGKHGVYTQAHPIALPRGRDFGAKSGLPWAIGRLWWRPKGEWAWQILFFGVNRFPYRLSEGLARP